MERTRIVLIDTAPLLREILREIITREPDLALVADKVAKTLVNCNVEVDAVLGGPLAHKGARVIYRQR